MRAYEFLPESKMRAGAVKGIPLMRKHKSLDNSSPYMPWRFAVALAGLPEFEMDREGPTGQKLVTVAYTDADADIISAAERLMGADGDDITSPGSHETDTVFTKCPVADWMKKS